MSWRVLEGDCREVLASLPAESVQTCVTSPPYWGLRDYGHAGQLGLERTPEEYVARMVEVFREVRRVLRPDGTLWLNLGDSYNSSPSNQQDGEDWPSREGAFRAQGRRKRQAPGLKPKDLVGIPWRVAFALQSDGWWLRSDIVWAKPNPMPESISDRPTKAHEYVFLLAKSASYFYDAEAVREDSKDPEDDLRRINADRAKRYSQAAQEARGSGVFRGPPVETCSGRNRRSVWNISTKPFTGAHFAVMPWDLVEPCVLAGTSERGQCPACGAPREREPERTGDNGGWRPTCHCADGAPDCFDPLDVPQTVLDPFTGSGTVGMVARRHGRGFVGVELNPAYAAMARERIRGDAPLLNLPTEAA